MATYVKFEDFVEQLCKGVHQFHATGHQFKVYLSNEAPIVGTDTGKADVTPITEENGYSATDIVNDVSESGGTASVTTTDYVEWTATGGSFGPFQYVLVYNEDATSPLDALVCYWDYGSSITVNTGEKFKVDFGTSLFTLS